MTDYSNETIMSAQNSQIELNKSHDSFIITLKQSIPMKKYLFAFLISCFTLMNTFAQPGGGIDMATGLRSSGKIYVVVIGLLVIFFGFIFYLFTIDKKIAKLEKEIKNQ